MGIVDLLELMARAPGAQAVLDALAGEPGVHVVGGAVRDALLGRVPRELDVVVEGDAAAVARRAAERLGGELVVHERFGTAVVRSRAATFDVVTARTETYAEPGALPEVRPGATIEEDLERRDFTVNAIALRLADGELMERRGARADLVAGVLRVLHERSFEDDPTRLLRMARYGARLGFEPDPDTDALAAAATVETVSGGRLGSELRLLLREPQPAALLALERHGLGRAVVHPGFAVGRGLSRRRSTSVHRTLGRTWWRSRPRSPARSSRPRWWRRSTGWSSTPGRAASSSRPPAEPTSSGTGSSSPASTTSPCGARCAGRPPRRSWWREPTAPARRRRSAG